jgi:hypothetical protein
MDSWRRSRQWPLDGRRLERQWGHGAGGRLEREWGELDGRRLERQWGHGAGGRPGRRGLDEQRRHR